MILELAQDFHDAVAAMPRGHPKLFELKSMGSLLNDRTEFLERFPRALTQEIVNYLDSKIKYSSANSLRRHTNEQLPHALLIEHRTITKGQIQGHYGPVCTLAVSPSGRQFLSGGHDGYVGYWERDRETPLWLVSAHKGGVTFVGFSPDGRQGISAGDEGSILLWNIPHGRHKPIFDEHVGPDTMWPSAPFCAFAGNDEIVFTRIGLCRKMVICTERVIWTNTEMFSGVDRSANSKCDMVRNAGILAIGDNYKKVTLYDINTGAAIRTLTTPGKIRHVAVSATADRALVVDHQGHVVVYDCNTGKEIGSQQFRQLEAVCRAYTGSIFFAYEPTGTIYRIETKNDLRTYACHTTAFESLIEPHPRSMVCLEDNDTLLLGRSSGELVLCSWNKGVITRKWPSGRIFSRGAIYSEGRRGIALVPQGSERAGHAHMGRGVGFILPSGETKTVLNIPHSHALSGVTTLDGGRAVTVDRGGGIVVWRKSKPVKRLTDTRFDFTACTTWHHAGLAVAGTRHDQIVILGVTGECEALSFPGTMYKDAPGIAAMAVAGKPISALILYSNGRVRLVGAKSWLETGHMLMGTAAALDPNCRFAATGNVNGEVVLWHCNDKNPVARMTLHSGEVTAMAFSHDGQVLYTAGTDRAIYEINPGDARLIWGTILPSPIIALMPQGVSKLYAMDSGGNLYRFINKRRQVTSKPAGWRPLAFLQPSKSRFT